MIPFSLQDCSSGTGPRSMVCDGQVSGGDLKNLGPHVKRGSLISESTDIPLDASSAGLEVVST